MQAYAEMREKLSWTRQLCFLFFISIFFVTNFVALTTSHRPDLSAMIINLNRIFIAIDPNHFGRSEIVSPARWLFLQLLACELILQLGPNTNTLCCSATLDANGTASWKLHRRECLRIAKQTSRMPLGALSFEEQRGASWLTQDSKQQATHR